jgi:hypothetical protein
MLKGRASAHNEGGRQVGCVYHTEANTGTSVELHAERKLD